MMLRCAFEYYYLNVYSWGGKGASFQDKRSQPDTWHHADKLRWAAERFSRLDWRH